MTTLFQKVYRKVSMPCDECSDCMTGYPCSDPEVKMVSRFIPVDDNSKSQGVGDIYG